MSKLATTALSWVAAMSLCFAQDRGTILGTFTDPSGAAVPGANVTAKNIQTGLTQAVKAARDGVYTIPYLPVGDYSVTTEMTGFRKSQIERVRVDVNSDVPLNVN